MRALEIVLVICSVCSVKCSTPCPELESVDITSGVSYDNGSILHEGIEYISGDWFTVSSDNLTSQLGCPCLRRLCLWKCCGPGQEYLARQCVSTNSSELDPFSPPVFTHKEAEASVAQEHFYYMYNHQLCGDRGRYRLDSNNNEMYVQKTGKLLEDTHGTEQWHDPGQFCVEILKDSEEASPHLIAAVCYPDDEETENNIPLNIVHAVGLLVSVFFLVITFLVYAFVPELRNLHGLCLMAYCGGIAVAYLCLANLKLHTGRIHLTLTSCLVAAFITYYAFLTSFFWLNVMCFDIWRTFRGVRGGSGSKRRSQQQFLAYGAYAWGVPALLTAATAAMQFADLPSDVMQPNFGKRSCWFDDWQNALVFFHTPFLVLVVCNVVLFSITSSRIRSIRQETAILSRAESARSDKMKGDKQRYGLYLKLFMVMGMNWIAELVGFVVGGSNWYWIILDVWNMMMGFIIFMIFVWKNRVRNLLRKRFRSIRGITATETSAGRWATSSAPTEDTRISADEGTRLKDIQLKELH